MRTPRSHLGTADLYSLNDDAVLAEHVLATMRLLTEVAVASTHGRGPACTLRADRPDWLSISHTSDSDHVGVAVNHQDGQRTVCRFERGNGDPTGRIAPARGDETGLRRFAAAAVHQISTGLREAVRHDPHAATLAGIGRAMRLHRRAPIVDWRREVHVQTATPWSPTRVFNIRVDDHGHCVPDRNLLGREALRAVPATAVLLTTMTDVRSRTLTISPFERSFDPDELPIVEEMRAYAALDAEASATR